MGKYLAVVIMFFVALSLVPLEVKRLQQMQSLLT